MSGSRFSKCASAELKECSSQKADNAVPLVGGSKPTRPIVRYHGGKWKLGPWIVSNLPPHRVYVEPFGGAGSVLLRKPRCYSEVYNDLDGEIVNVFRVLRDPAMATRLKVALELTPFARDEFNLSYEPSDDPVEQARRTIARAFMGFGSNAHNRKTGFRANSNRSGTTPAHDWANYPKCLETVIERLRGVVVENRDACACMRQHDAPETLHYVDPPYVHSTRKDGQLSNYRHEMTDADHEALAECLHGLEGMVVLSGYPSELYDRLYAGWQRIDKDAHADGARDRVECLWLNPAASAAIPPPPHETQNNLFEGGAK